MVPLRGATSLNEADFVGRVASRLWLTWESVGDQNLDLRYDEGGFIGGRRGEGFDGL